MADIQRVSTAAVPPQERLEFWNDACMGATGAAVVDADPEHFQGALTTLRAGQLRISSVKSTPAVSRSPAKNCSDEAAFSLQLVHSGRCRIRHAGVDSMALPGDMLISDRHKTYELAFAEPIQGLVVSLPWARFRDCAETFEAMAGRLINVNSGPGAVLAPFIRSAWDHLLEREDEDWPQSATEVIWDLMAAVLRGDTGRETAGRRADGLRREAGALIDRRLSDAGFGSSSIAEALGVSPRYLQMVFAEVGTTPSRVLLARRLDAAAARLRRLERSCSITELALECGFNDLSYFSRAFRRRFGISARDYRNERR